jgi:hypothetical protein
MARSRSGSTRPIAEAPQSAADLIRCSPTEPSRNLRAVPGRRKARALVASCVGEAPTRLRMSPIGEKSIEGSLGDRLSRSRTLRDPPVTRNARPSRASVRREAPRGADGLLRGLQGGSAAAGADERLDLGAVVTNRERLEVGLVATVRADAVHPRRLRVETAHRHLAADRTGAGHRGPRTGQERVDRSQVRAWEHE